MHDASEFGLIPLLTQRETTTQVTFRLEGVDERAGTLLAATFWTAVEGGWERSFDRSGYGIPDVARNLPRLIGPMSAQVEVTTRPWREALSEIARRLDGTGVSWWLTGSGATALRVPGIQPHDLDVMVGEADPPLVAHVFADALVEPLQSTSGWVTRAFGVAWVGLRVDIAAGPEPWVDDPHVADFGPWAAAHLETIVWHGAEIRVPPLAVQADVNRRRGRLDRAAQIEAAIGAAGEGSQPTGETNDTNRESER